MQKFSGRSCWILLLISLIKGQVVRQNISINVTGILSVHFYRKKIIDANSLMLLETMFPWEIANMQFIRTKFTKVFRSLFDIGDQAGTCAQLFYVKERSYGFEQELDVAIKVVMVMKDMICKKDIDPSIHVCP